MFFSPEDSVEVASEVTDEPPSQSYVLCVGSSTDVKIPELNSTLCQSFSSARSFLNAYMNSDSDTVNKIKFCYPDSTEQASEGNNDDKPCCSSTQRPEISKQQMLARIGDIENRFLELQKQMEAICDAVSETSEAETQEPKKRKVHVLEVDDLNLSKRC